jgi:hypothetical protein
MGEFDVRPESRISKRYRPEEDAYARELLVLRGSLFILVRREEMEDRGESSGGRVQMGSEAVSSDTFDEVHSHSRLGAIVIEDMKAHVARVHTVDSH